MYKVMSSKKNNCEDLIISQDRITIHQWYNHHNPT